MSASVCRERRGSLPGTPDLVTACYADTGKPYATFAPYLGSRGVSVVILGGEIVTWTPGVQGVLVWPFTLAMLVAVIVAFGSANLYIIVLATRRVRQAATLASLTGGLISSVGLTLLELGALSALRSLLIGAFGFSWGV